MAMNQQRKPRLKPLLAHLPPGFIIDTSWLKRRGIDSKSIFNYVQRGWLEKVIRGVYRRPHTEQTAPVTEDWQIPMLSIQWIMGYDIHLGGQSALSHHGHVHYLPLGGEERVYLFGKAPTWLMRLPVTAQFIVRSRSLFNDDPAGIENAEHQLNTISEPGSRDGPAVSPWRWPLKVSSPERAILEAIDELPGHAGFHNLDMIFQGLSNLRPLRLETLLQICKSIKVRRLFFVFADRHNHAWLRHIKKNKINLGSGPRYLVKGGKLHPVYRIYVPAEFLPVIDTEKGAKDA